MSDLAQQLAQARHGDHVCLVYEDPAEQMAVVVPYIKAGLAAGERCLYVADDRTLGEVVEALTSAGVDVQAEIARTALLLRTKHEAHLASGVFDPISMTAFLRQGVDQAIADGFTGLRTSGEMTWALGSEPGCDRVIEYEACLSDFFPGSKAIGLCQYNRRRFAAPMIRDVLRTHPTAVLGDQVCPNIYYEPPQMVLGPHSDEWRVQWMIDQLRRARSAARTLEEAITVRDNFLSIASHELRTPLTSLQLQIQGLSRKANAGDTSSFAPERIKPKLASLERQTARLGRLVQELLDVSRIATGKLQLSPEPVDVASVAADVLDRLEPTAAQVNSTLVGDISSVVGIWDASALDHILVNLLSNALKYGAGKPVHLVIDESDGQARIVVRDQGIGIAPEHHTRIFERFERAVPTQNYGGFGVGLWVTQQLVQSMRGTICVESAVGRGATFTVTLPKGA